MSLHDALAAQERFAPPRAPSRNVIAVGNAGALGEAVLARLLSARAYGRVHVATRMPLGTSAPRLVPLDFTGLHSTAGWQADTAITDAVLIVGGQHSYFRRDDAFPILSENDAAALARNAHAAGCTRLMLIAPMDAWTAMTLGNLAHFDEMEREISALGFDTLVVVRPTTHRRAEAAGNWLDRLAGTFISTATQYMTSASRQPMRAQIVAEAAVSWFTTLPAGYHRQDAAALYAWQQARQAAREKAAQ